MTQKLLAPDYKTSFATGQGGGISNYDQYPEDHDTNYTLIQTAINEMIDQLQGLRGPNFLIPLDLTQSTSPAVVEGTIGEHSYSATLTGGSPLDEFTVEPGAAILSGGSRVSLSSQQVLVATGQPVGSGTLWVALATTGNVSLETSAGQQALDLWSADWDATDLSNIVRLASVFPDGDDFQDLLTVVGNAGAGPPAQTHGKIANRIENIERILRAVTTNIVAGETALGRIAIGGSAATPGMITGDGTTFDGTTGLFRQAANVLSASVSGTEVWRTVAAALRTVTGSVSVPAYGFITDTNKGMYSPGTNRLGFATGGTLALEIDSTRFIDSPTQARVRTTATAAALASSTTPSNVTMGTEITDVGDWFSPPAIAHTVPTGAAGFYLISAGVFFDESTAGANQNTGEARHLRIQLNGSTNLTPQAIVTSRKNNAVTNDTFLNLSILIQLAAGDVLRLQAAQDSGSSMDINATFSAVKLW